jgi:hypothetical protein
MAGCARKHLKIEQYEPAEDLCNRWALSHACHNTLTTHTFVAANKRAALCVFCNSDGTRLAALGLGRARECRGMGAEG